MTTPRDLYDEHARAALKEPVPYILNTFREHADRFVHVMKTVRALTPETIIDLACNLGLFGAMFRWTHGYAPKQVIGVDVSQEALAFAHLISGYDQIQPYDIEELVPLPKADLVLCMEVLEHVAKPERVVANALALSKGHVLFSVPDEQDEVDGTYHVRKVAIDLLIGWVEAAGGRVVNFEHVESMFCEKPHWTGWWYVLAKPQGVS